MTEQELIKQAEILTERDNYQKAAEEWKARAKVAAKFYRQVTAERDAAIEDLMKLASEEILPCELCGDMTCENKKRYVPRMTNSKPSDCFEYQGIQKEES